MALRVPTPSPFFSQTEESQFRAELQREDALNAKLNSNARFAALVSNSAQFIGDMSVGGNLAITGNLTVTGTTGLTGPLTWGSLSLPGTFAINGTSCSRVSMISALSSQPQNRVFATPVGAAGFLLARPLAMADFPDYVVLGQPDATVVTIANTVAASALGQPLALTANQLAIGDCIRMTCRGVYGDAAVAPTLLLEVRMASGAVLVSTAANTVASTTLTNRGWEVKVDFICTALGALTGRLEVQGRAHISNGPTIAQDIDMENTTPIVFNTTIAQTLTLFVTWGTAAALNTITCRQTIWEILQA